VLAASFDVDSPRPPSASREQPATHYRVQGSASHSQDSDPPSAPSGRSGFGDRQITARSTMAAPRRRRRRRPRNWPHKAGWCSIRSQSGPQPPRSAPWVANEGAKIAVAASESEVRAAGVALEGVRKEAQAATHHG